MKSSLHAGVVHMGCGASSGQAHIPLDEDGYGVVPDTVAVITKKSSDLEKFTEPYHQPRNPRYANTIKGQEAEFRRKI